MTTFNSNIRGWPMWSALGGVVLLTPFAAIAQPAAPTHVAATGFSPSKMDVSWSDQSEDEDTFVVERKQGAGSYASVGTVDRDELVFQDTALSAGTAYTYRVKAVNGAGSSTFASEATDSTAAAFSPSGRPLELATTAITSTRIDLSWSDTSANETSFGIERKTTGSFTQIATVAADATSYSDTTVSASTVYYYRVRAHRSGYPSSNYSNEAHSLTGAASPASINLSSFTVTSFNLPPTMTWTCTNNALGYIIYRFYNNYNLDMKEIANIPQEASLTCSFTDTDAPQVTGLTYLIRGYNTGGQTGFTSSATGDTNASGPVDHEPTDLTATAISKMRVDLSWPDNSTNDQWYLIERKSSGDYSQIDSILGGGDAYYSDTTVSAATNYTYRIRATNSYSTTAYSPEATATTQLSTLPAMPTFPYAVGYNSTRVDVYWTDNVAAETGFIVERKPSGGSWSVAGTAAGNTTSYTVTGLNASTSYQFRVRAQSAAGYGFYTPPFSERTADSGTPNRPSDISVTETFDGNLEISWADNSSNETEFIIERADGRSDFEEVARVSANVTTYTDPVSSCAKKNIQRSYRVRAANNAGISKDTLEYQYLLWSE